MGTLTTTLIFDLALPSGDLDRIRAMLLDAGLLVPGFAIGSEALYDPVTYLADEAMHGSTTAALLDRNIVSRILALDSASGMTKHHHLSAAVLVFLQCAGILVEPNIALYEYAHTHGAESALADLAKFRRLDNGDVLGSPISRLGEATGCRSPPWPTPCRRRLKSTLRCL